MTTSTTTHRSETTTTTKTTTQTTRRRKQCLTKASLGGGDRSDVLAQDKGVGTHAWCEACP
jgi:hypothetical protein